MAKKETIELKAKTGSMYAYLRQGSVAPFIREERWTTDPWIWHGRKNLFPEYIRALVDNCGPLERCITMLAQFIAGKGVRFYDEEGNEIEAAQDLFQEWMIDTPQEDFLWRTAYDLAHGLGKSWNVRRSATDIVRLDHLDRFGLRSGKLVDGRVNEYWWSSNWEEYQLDNSNELYKPEKLKAFDFRKDAKPQAQATIFSKSYRPREPYYGGLWWMGAIQAAEVWTRIDNYNRTQIDTGFAGAGMLVTHFNGTESELKKHKADVQAGWAGSNGQALLHIPVGQGEEAPIFTPFDRGNNAGEMDEIRSACADVMYDVIGIPSLLLRDREAGLTSQERAIFMRLQQMMRTLVEPIQQWGICKDLQRLMTAAGIPVWEARIDQLQIFDTVQSDAIVMASTTVDEARLQRGAPPAEDKEWGAKPLALASTPPQLAVDPETGLPMEEKKGPDGKPMDKEEKKGDPDEEDPIEA